MTDPASSAPEPPAGATTNELRLLTGDNPPAPIQANPVSTAPQVQPVPAPPATTKGRADGVGQSAPEDRNQAYLDDVQLKPSEADPRSLAFSITKKAPDRPAELTTLMGEFNEVARKAGVLLDLERRRTLLTLIRDQARETLCGPHFSIADGKSVLGECRERTVDAAVLFRSSKLRTYMWYLFGLGVPLLIAGLAYFKTSGFGMLEGFLKPYAGLTSAIASSCLIIAGAV